MVGYVPAGRAAQGVELEDHVGGFLNRLAAAGRVSPATIRHYAADLERFLTFARGRGAEAPVDEAMIRAFLDDLRARGQAEATVARRLSAIRAFFRYLTGEGMLDDNPVALVAGPHIRRQPPRYLHLDELQSLLGLPDRTARGLRDRAVLETLWATGLRLGQVQRLNLEDVEAGGKFIRVREGRETRRLAVSTGDGGSLAEYLDRARPVLLRSAGSHTGDTSGSVRTGSPCRALFLNRRGDRLSRRGIRRLVDRYLDRLAGASPLGQGDLRGALASRLLDEGADRLAVKEMLGRGSLAGMRPDATASQGRLRAVYETAHPRAGGEVWPGVERDDDSSG